MADEPTIITLVLEKLELTERSLNERLNITERALGQRLDRQDRDLAEIVRQTTKTNGRVTQLEKARERAAGAMWAVSWVPSTLSAILGAGLTILVLALSGGIH